MYCETHPARQFRAYYRSKKPAADDQCVYIPCDELDAQIPELLAQVSLEPAEADSFLDAARRELERIRPEGQAQEAKTLEASVRKLEQQRKNLISLATDPDNGITPDEFRQERERLTTSIDQTRFQLRRLQQQIEQAEEGLAACLEGLVHLDHVYHDSQIKGRRELVRLVFRRLTVEGGRIVGVEFRSPFAYVARLKRSAGDSSDSDRLGPPTAILSELLCN